VEIIKILLIFVLGLFGIYLFFRIAGLAIAKSWRQTMHGCGDCNKENGNKKQSKKEEVV